MSDRDLPPVGWIVFGMAVAGMGTLLLLALHYHGVVQLPQRPGVTHPTETAAAPDSEEEGVPRAPAASKTIARWKGKAQDLQEENAALRNLLHLEPDSPIPATLAEIGLGSIASRDPDPRDSTPAGTSAEGEPAAATDTRYLEFLRTSMQAQLKARLTQMQRRLRLSPSQMDAIRAVLDEVLEAQMEMSGPMWGGEAVSPERMAELTRIMSGRDDAVKQKLTAEQVVAYDDFLHEEQRQQLVQWADYQVNEFVKIAPLPEERRGALHGAILDFYETAQQEPQAATVPDDFWENWNLRLLERIRPILDPAEIAAFETFLRDQAEQYRAMQELWQPNGDSEEK